MLGFFCCLPIISAMSQSEVQKLHQSIQQQSKNNVQISVFFHHRNKNIISRIIEVTSPSTSLFLQKKMKCLIISSEKNEAPHYFLVSGSTAGLLARS
jgi:hypothetical protein